MHLSSAQAVLNQQSRISLRVIDYTILKAKQKFWQQVLSSGLLFSRAFHKGRIGVHWQNRAGEESHVSILLRYLPCGVSNSAVHALITRQIRSIAGEAPAPADHNTLHPVAVAVVDRHVYLEVWVSEWGSRGRHVSSLGKQL